MIELLVALIMISILMVSAFLSWGSYVDEARVVTTQNRMDGIRKALETWSADHTRSYPTYDLNPLLGRYLPATEGDGWGNDFLVDRYMLRIISRGRNGVLDTPIPGWDEGPLGGFGGDDLIQEAQENGRLVMVGGNGLFMVRPDGTRFIGLADGFSAGDIAPGGGAVVWGDGANFFRDWISSDESLGSYDIGAGASQSVVMTWFTDPFGNTGWGTISIAPDGLHIAAFRSAGSYLELVVGELVDPAEAVSAPPFLVTTFPTAQIEGAQYGRIAWGRRSGSLYVNNKEGADIKIARLNAAPRSGLTTYSWGVVDNNTPSVDVCGTRQRIVFMHDDKAILASGSGTILTSATVPTGTVTKVAVNRRCDAITILDSSDNIYIWWPDRPVDPSPGGEGNPFLVLDGATVSGALGPVVELRWR
jgi:hypothetical protein